MILLIVDASLSGKLKIRSSIFDIISEYVSDKKKEMPKEQTNYYREICKWVN